MIKTYRGSCHCRRITLEVDLDLSQGTGKCNCTLCWKRRLWAARAKTGGFRLISGQSDLTSYPPKPNESPGGFCRHCGVGLFWWVQAAAWNDGESVSVSLACLDDVEPGELLAAPVQHFDGRSDTWGTPAETRHL